MGVPSFLQSALWSIDVRTIDLKKDKHYIIEQVLNYGTWEQLKWLLKTYSVREIKQVFRHPSRGVWHDDVFNYWETLYHINVSKTARKRALFSLKPQYFPLSYAKQISRRHH